MSPFPALRPSLFALLAVLLLFGCRGGASAGSEAAEGAAVPDLAFQTLDGREVKLSSYRGRVVLVDFWATWCQPCHVQARILEPLHQEFAGVQFVGLNVGEDPKTVQGFLAGKPLPYPVLLDPDNSGSDRVGVFALPTVMVVDKTGRIAYLHAGISDGPTLRKALKEAGA